MRIETIEQGKKLITHKAAIETKLSLLQKEECVVIEFIKSGGGRIGRIDKTNANFPMDENMLKEIQQRTILYYEKQLNDVNTQILLLKDEPEKLIISE